MTEETPHTEETRIEGLNAKYLSPEQTATHLTHLHTHLTHLQKIAESENWSFAHKAIQDMSDSVEALKLKHSLSGRYSIDIPLMIDPTASGFPTYTDFYYLARNQQAAALVETRSMDDMINDAWRSICHGNFPTDVQMEYTRKLFFEKLSTMDVFADFKMRITNAGTEQNRRVYQVQWFGIEDGKNIPVAYNMYLEQDVSARPLEETQERTLKMLLQGAMKLAPHLDHIGRMVDNDPKLHPKLIEKLLIGPFYTAHTVNPPDVETLFDNSGVPSLMQFTYEIVSSAKVKKISSSGLSRLLGGTQEQEVFGSTITQRGLLIPYRGKQELEKEGIHKGQGKIYGFTDGGDLYD